MNDGSRTTQIRKDLKMLVLSMKIGEKVEFYIEPHNPSYDKIRIGHIELSKTHQGSATMLFSFQEEVKILREKVGPPRKL
jgi:hypothetical protein